MNSDNIPSSEEDVLPLLLEEPGWHGTESSFLPTRALERSSSLLATITSYFASLSWQSFRRPRKQRKRCRDPIFRQLHVDIRRDPPLNGVRSRDIYPGNWIRSNRYTLLNFVPKQVVAQFSKIANFYFLCFAILQLIPGLSTIGNKTNIVPLSIFITISMAKEAWDDYRRYRLDQLENAQRTSVLDVASSTTSGTFNWQSIEWQHLEVGNVIRILRDEAIPADVVLLGSQLYIPNDDIYIETIALDGETNLKRKRPARGIANACATFDRLASCVIQYEIEQPNADLYNFKGSVDVDGQISSLNNTNIVYRGSVLRNTTETMAMVVYSGEECKIRLNANGDGRARVKAPRLQSTLNIVIVLVVSLVIGLSVYNTVAYKIWEKDVESTLFYLASSFVPLHREIFGFVIMFATMVPLSLYVSMEMIKAVQIFLLNSDVEMYDAASNVPFQARTSTINEDLGQITHIFTDKTGTLTSNAMVFRKLYVEASEWVCEDGLDQCPYEDGSADRISLDTKFQKSKANEKSRTTGTLMSYMHHHPHSVLARKTRLLLSAMALCHDCTPEPSCSTNSSDIQGTSPDEIALVKAAYSMGFRMTSRDRDSITLQVIPSADNKVESEVYKIMDVIEFSNQRKRMSVIVEFPNGKLYIICKGADSVIIERIRPSHETDSSNFGPAAPGALSEAIEIGTDLTHKNVLGDCQSSIQDCIDSVNQFAGEGLRTLLYAYRPLSNEEYVQWKQLRNATLTDIQDDAVEVESIDQLLEKDLELLGATAIEDKLQDDVPQSIDKFSRANIKVWMVTGDKLETAISIGRSCGLIKVNSDVTVLARKDNTNFEQILTSRLEAVEDQVHNVIAIDCDTLKTIYDDPSGHLETQFFNWVVRADSVICCRAQPSQKAQLVRTIRTRLPEAVTLAVGDGANDIAMIQEAHVGIGIMGKEGSQAARSSDYSIGQFRFLQRLILVHGRYNYIRTCKYILGTLWKEIVFFLPQALFQRQNGFTGTSLYEPWSLTTYNTIFTSLPVMIIGMFEKDLAASTLLAVPELYSSLGQKGRGFSIWVFIGWTVLGVAEAFIVYFSMLKLYANPGASKDDTLFPMGDLCFVAVVIIISMKLQIIEMHNKSIVAFLSLFLSVGAAFLWNIILAATYPTTKIYKARGGFFFGFGRDPVWWATLIFIVVCVFLLEISVLILRKTFFPTQTDKFQEIERETAEGKRFPESVISEMQVNLSTYKDVPVVTRSGADIEMQSLSSSSS